MKKKASLFTLLIGLISLSGCYNYAPASADYNGKTYKNGWYQCFAKNGRDLYPIGLKYDENKAPLFNKEKYIFWFTDQFSFDLLYAEYEDSQFWHPDVYVFKEELKDAQKFY